MNAAVLTVATGSLPGSRKIYLSGLLNSSLRVPMREITLHPEAQESPLRVYDASGPYTDPTQQVDISRGLPRLRDPWIHARADSESYAGRTLRPNDNGLAENAGAAAHEFPIRHAPRRARSGGTVTQLRYARAGIITPEMEFIAIRENQGRERARDHLARDGESWGAHIPDYVTSEFVRDEVAAGRAIIPANINHPESGADDHRTQLPGEDQCQHWQLRRELLDGRGGR